MTCTPLFSSLPSGVYIRRESAVRVRATTMHALSWPGDRSLRKVAGLVRPRPSWSKGASGTIAPMKRRRAWRGQWPRKSSFASFWLIVFTCHILLANKNGEFFKFLKRFCQVFTPNTKQVNCSGWHIECRIWTDSCITHYCTTYCILIYNLLSK